jgi:hypothetical protein
LLAGAYAPGRPSMTDPIRIGRDLLGEVNLIARNELAP